MTAKQQQTIVRESLKWMKANGQENEIIFNGGVCQAIPGDLFLRIQRQVLAESHA
jgi:hypothetical protein